MAAGHDRRYLLEYKAALPGFMTDVYQANTLAQMRGDWQLQELNNERMTDQ